jgi:hypothetical protein
MMNILRKHWFDLGGVLAIILLICIYNRPMPSIHFILWLSLASLFIHQLEEYRYPGYFPGMMNTVMYKSEQPDRYPLNSQTSLFVNVLIGWLFYFLAAVFADKCIWLGIATMLVSCGNIIAHTILFNVKGKTWYNPGMATALLLFLPLSCWFVHTLYINHLPNAIDCIAGIVLGIILNIVGILKMIDWMADKNTRFIFEPRQLNLK